MAVLGMTSKTTSIPILYAGGLYGTFVEWSINYFSGNTDITYPFLPLGHSHRFSGNTLKDMDLWHDYLKSGGDHTLVRFHPKSETKRNLKQNLDEIFKSVNKAIYLYVDEDFFLCTLNNRFERVKNFADGSVFSEKPHLSNKLKNWEVNSWAEMQPWQKREFLSMYAWNSHACEIELHTVLNFTDDRLLKIHVRELFVNYENCIIKILSHCNLPLVKNDFKRVHTEWLSLQTHANKDRLINQIVDSIINNIEFDWETSNISLIDESAIQMKLRDLHNTHLKCYNLNIFPTNTSDFKKILINE